ncbi:MAG: PAS domain S-box protein [Desulfocapsa sp.]|nr:PAS domain S-box protein [Desulfocapsa sp.]
MDFITIDNVFLIGIIVIQFVVFRFLQKKDRPYLPADYQENPYEKYRDLFENANDAIFMLDENHNYIEVNPRAVELFGFSREEFLGMNVKDVIPPAQVSKSDEEFKRLREQGKYEKFTGKQKTKDGRWLDIEVNSSVIISGGKIIGSRDIVRDISERKKADREREHLITDLQKALDEIKSLKGILPLCSFCKNIRDPKGEWKQVDVFIHDHSEAAISHTVCPDCMKKHYPEGFEKR